ncbi:hypothetical protein AGLY_014201 [Aphis glycines]|uniref:Uncharacterized protein n=1 Tax=Aphis glycines TaxID=307491 RepID=A0A6G0T4E5_APHGL|nr:hypothetical protein AGLY_014201 [Aphis glycines]
MKTISVVWYTILCPKSFGGGSKNRYLWTNLVAIEKSYDTNDSEPLVWWITKSKRLLRTKSKNYYNVKVIKQISQSINNLHEMGHVPKQIPNKFNKNKINSINWNIQHFDQLKNFKLFKIMLDVFQQNPGFGNLMHEAYDNMMCAKFYIMKCLIKHVIIFSKIIKLNFNILHSQALIKESTSSLRKIKRYNINQTNFDISILKK